MLKDIDIAKIEEALELALELGHDLANEGYAVLCFSEIREAMAECVEFKRQKMIPHGVDKPYQSLSR